MAWSKSAMRAVGVAAHAIGRGAVGIGRRKARVELDHLVEIGDGAAEVALGQIGVAARIERDRVARVELDRALEIGDGAVESPRLRSVRPRL